jgi:hypothetical protein
MSCGIILDKGMLHIMMHLTQSSMVHKKVKGYVAICLLQANFSICCDVRTELLWLFQEQMQ